MLSRLTTAEQKAVLFGDTVHRYYLGRESREAFARRVGVDLGVIKDVVNGDAHKHGHHDLKRVALGISTDPQFQKVMDEMIRLICALKHSAY